MCILAGNTVSGAVPNVAAGFRPEFANQLGNQLGGIDFAAAFNNPTLMNLATQMMSDPSMQDTITQLRSQIDGMNNMDGIFEVYVFCFFFFSFSSKFRIKIDNLHYLCLFTFQQRPTIGDSNAYTESTNV